MFFAKDSCRNPFISSSGCSEDGACFTECISSATMHLQVCAFVNREEEEWESVVKDVKSNAFEARRKRSDSLQAVSPTSTGRMDVRQSRSAANGNYSV